MSDKNSSFINLPDLPDSVDNAVKNLTDKPTQGIGQTLADAWYLVFSPITQAANKRRMKYAHNLELYKQELSLAISSIPERDLIEPDIQTTAQALENSKYCIESEDLRKMFVNLISSSMDNNYIQSTHPSFAEIIKQMSSLDARILKSLNPHHSFPLVDYVLNSSTDDEFRRTFEINLSNVYIPNLSGVTIQQASSSISSLSRLGIISIDTQSTLSNSSIYVPYEQTDYYLEFSRKARQFFASKRADIHKYLGQFTPLGKNFYEVCVK